MSLFLSSYQHSHLLKTIMFHWRLIKIKDLHTVLNQSFQTSSSLLIHIYYSLQSTCNTPFFAYFIQIYWPRVPSDSFGYWHLTSPSSYKPHAMFSIMFFLIFPRKTWPLCNDKFFALYVTWSLKIWLLIEAVSRKICGKLKMFSFVK